MCKDAFKNVTKITVRLQRRISIIKDSFVTKFLALPRLKKGLDVRKYIFLSYFQLKLYFVPVKEVWSSHILSFPFRLKFCNNAQIEMDFIRNGTFCK